ncbi:MAG: hypothetical protein M3O82_06225, partial [Verrucomicrobiota bacterium]|nr:hypothetical protein [Verrucomicrobiota bacterium]
LTNGSKRELLLRFWYPASLTQSCQPAEYTAPSVWKHFSELVGIALPEVTTNSCWNAPAEPGRHPVVIFSPGYTATFTDYTFLFEDLASRGYVVASVDHTFEATAVEFPDGRFVKSVLGSHLGGTFRGDDQAISLAVSVRLQDLHFVVGEMQRLNDRAQSPLMGVLDLTRIAVAGHSMGGSIAVFAAGRDPRLKTAISLDGVIFSDRQKALSAPVFLLTSGREKWSADDCGIWKNLRAPKSRVDIPGAEHVTTSDAVWLAKGAVQTGGMDSDQIVAAIRDHVAAFLDANLRGEPSNSDSTRPSWASPNAIDTTQNDPFCHAP